MATALDMDIQTTSETISPEMAKRLLTGMRGNRSLSRATVLRYASDMKGGRWRLNGEPLILDRDSKLLDGQHRLHACIEANVSFETLVVRGVEAATFDTLDNGLRRTLGHVLGIRGEKDPGALSSALRIVREVETGWSDAHRDTTTELEECLSRHAKIRESVEFINGLKAELNYLMPLTVPTAMHYLGTKSQGRSLADSFWMSVATGENLTQFHPALLLRKRMLALNQAGKRSGGRAARKAIAAYTIKAWNAYISKDDMATLRFDPDTETMPTLV